MKISGRAMSLILAVGLVACGGGDSAEDGASEAEAATVDAQAGAAEEWWIEIEGTGLEIPRVSGSSVRVITTGPRHSVRGSNRSTNSHIAFTYDGTEPGSYETQNLRVKNGEEHVCVATGAIEVESVEPLVATMSGSVECWEGTEYGPEDPDNPGTALEGAEGTFTAGIQG